MRNLMTLCVMLVAIILPMIGHAQTLFKKGVNLTSWFQASSPQQIPFGRFSKKDMQDIKSLGCDVIRLPINLHAMTLGAPGYTLDPLFLQSLDQAVDWSEELGLNILLDNHTFDPNVDTQPDIGNILVKVWSQMADHYKGRSTKVYYEVLNEPHGISASAWGAIQQSVIDAIREKDKVHTIIVGGVNYNSYTELKNIPNYTDANLIYTFHFYDPFLFTHQGANWVVPSMAPVANVPFPYQAAKMPGVPASLKGTWIESMMNEYPQQGTAAKVKELLDQVVTFQKARNVPVFCGEFGVLMTNSENDQRVAWYSLVREYLELKKISWTMWDYTGGFGIFKKGSDELFEYDVNLPLVKSLGLIEPPQKVLQDQLVKTGFTLYDDLLGAGIQSISSTGAELNFYDESEVKDGEKSILWKNPAQYASIDFDFRPNLNLSLLAENNFTLDFWLKGSGASGSIDIRFVDTKKDNADHPWRLGKTLDAQYFEWDNEWHHISIPLNDLAEKGSWDNAWFPAEGKFKWEEVDKFEIVAEQQSLETGMLHFDDVRISGEAIVTAVNTLEAHADFKVYPNPAHDHIVVEYSIKDPFALELCTILGQKIKNYQISGAGSGTRVLTLDVSNIPAGIYVVRLVTKTEVSSTKVFVAEPR